MRIRNMPHFLFNPKVTMAALLSVVAITAANIVLLLNYQADIKLLFGVTRSQDIILLLQKSEGACNLLTVILTWITAYGRSVSTRVDTAPPSQAPPTEVKETPVMSNVTDPVPAEQTPVVAVAPKLTWYQYILLALEKLVHPEAQAAMAGIAKVLQDNKSVWVAEASVFAGTAEAFLESKANALIASSPIVAPFATFILPTMQNFIATEIGYGKNDLATAIDKLAAWFIAEEKFV